MKVLLTTALLVFSQLLFSQEKYPSYERVVKRFFKEYIVSVDDYARISFQKRPEGWSVAKELYEDGYYETKSVETYWDRKSGEFNLLSFKKRPEDLEAVFNTYKKVETELPQVTNYIERWDARLFSICPYYNYDGWEADVIKDFDKRDNLSDSTLYALGRAYSSYASHLLSNQYGRSTSIKQFELDQSEFLNSSQIKKYRKYQHGAIEAFAKLASRNPDFQTIVGPIGVKASNEHLTSYINLMMYGTEQEALKELKDDLYDPFYLSLAKNYLNSCEPNAILITGGDTDTFPLWYIQAKHGIRRDVTVMVSSYVNTHRFVKLMSRESELYQALDLSIDLVNYDENGPNIYLPILAKVEGPIDVSQYLELINENHEALRYELGESYYNIVPSPDLSVPTSGFFEKHSLTPSLMEYSLEEQLIFSPTSKGLEMRDLVLLDIIATGDWKRPVYFNNTSLTQTSLNIDKHIIQEGLSYRLIPIEKGDAVNHTKMYDNVMNKFDWDFTEMAGREISDEKNFIFNYRSMINSLVASLLENDESEKAKEILLASFEWMPKDIFSLDYFNAEQISYLFQLGEVDLANDLAEELYEIASDQLEDLLSTGSKNTELAQGNLYVLRTLIDTFEEQNMKDKVAQYEQAYQKYEVLIYEQAD